MSSEFYYLTKPYLDIRRFEVGILQNKESFTSDIIFATGKRAKNIPNDYLKKLDISKVGDNFDHKICNMCGRLLPTEEFQKNQNGKNNRTVRRPSCIECRKKIDGKSIPSKERKEWIKNHPEPHFIVWSCPICHKVTIPGITSKVVLDHNHETGHPRAWICDSCNTGLGRFKDNISILKNAIEYLKEHNDEE